MAQANKHVLMTALCYNLKKVLKFVRKQHTHKQVLQHLYPQHSIRVSGSEKIPEKEKGSYDVVASNIPFGDTTVFDLSYSRGKDLARTQATCSIHNYFFLRERTCSVKAEFWLS